MPYAWLHRTKLYIFLAVATSLGAFGLQLLLGSLAFHIILFYVGVLFWMIAPFVYRQATQLAKKGNLLAPSGQIARS